MSSKLKETKTNEHLPVRSDKSGSGHMSIDEINRRILKFLTWDARLSYREVARNAKISTTTVIERMKKMKADGIITGYSVNLDARKLGYEMTAIIELVAPKIILRKAMKELDDVPNVYGVYHTTGDVDAIIIAKFRTVEDLQTFLSELYEKYEVQRSETRIVLNTVKEDFRVIL